MPVNSAAEPERDAQQFETSVGERASAVAIAIVLATAGILAVRFGDHFLGENTAVFPAVYAGSFVAMLVSATISRNQFKTTGLPTLAFLSNLFGISALMLIPFVAVMPHVFSPSGMGFGDRSAVWLWIADHAAFAVLVLAYVAGEVYFGKRVVTNARAHAIGQRYAIVAGASTCAVIAILLGLHGILPSLGDANGFSPLFHRAVEPVLLVLDAIALVAIVAATRMRNTTSIWLGIIVLSFGIQTYVGAESVHAAYSVGWYVLFVVGPAIQALYILVQLRSANDQLVAYAEDKKVLIEETLRDPLTNLLNRRGFDERFEDILSDSRISGTAASIVIFDIDYFKAFNDSFGHPAGDDALKKISEAVAGVANRPSDACCRVGGEEFAIVLGETDASGAMTVAEKVRSSVMRLRLPQDPELSDILTVSVGTATAFPNVVLTASELYERADKALYKAKRLGRNRIATHDVSREANLQVV